MKVLDIVIFGGTGDLSLRKLMPALYFLYDQGTLTKDSRILALSRGKMSRDEFVVMVMEKLETYLGAEYCQVKAQDFGARLDYRDLDISDDGSWDRLTTYLNVPENSGANSGANSGNRREIIYYMAVPPSLFGTVCGQLGRQNLNQDNSRLVVEKPLGENAQTAEAVNQALSASFREDQIYRIDHYLGKAAVQNILSFRFEDGSLEHCWNRRYIDHIQITVAETVGVEGRANFLDRVGILRDMIQNHVMQILCFVVMDAPKSFAADDVRDAKVSVVNALRPIMSDNIRGHVVRAQYGGGQINGQEVSGYRQEITDKGAAGTGETYVALKVFVDNDRWRDVPFYLRTGKRLSGRYAQIMVQFKAMANAETDEALPNRVLFNIQPDMTLYFDDCPRGDWQDAGHDRHIQDAYEKLLGDVIRGDQAYFVRHDEIIASWRWIDGIRKAWDGAKLEMCSYASGSMGPKASEELLAVSGHEWYED